MATDRKEKRTWIIFKATGKAHDWKSQKLIPDGGLTEIIREAWDYSGGKYLPNVGERVTEFRDGCYRQSDWIVDSINHFSSSDTQEHIIVCYCHYLPVKNNWQEAHRGKPVDEMLKVHSSGC